MQSVRRFFKSTTGIVVLLIFLVVVVLAAAGIMTISGSGQSSDTPSVHLTWMVSWNQDNGSQTSTQVPVVYSLLMGDAEATHLTRYYRGSQETSQTALASTNGKEDVFPNTPTSFVYGLSLGPDLMRPYALAEWDVQEAGPVMTISAEGGRSTLTLQNLTKVTIVLTKQGTTATDLVKPGATWISGAYSAYRISIALESNPNVSVGEISWDTRQLRSLP